MKREETICPGGRVDWGMGARSATGVVEEVFASVRGFFLGRWSGALLLPCLSSTRALRFAVRFVFSLYWLSTFKIETGILTYLSVHLPPFAETAFLEVEGPSSAKFSTSPSSMVEMCLLRSGSTTAMRWEE